ncbi:MAG: hypothetical protein ACTSWN_10490 [Promethearchaeota archaeon]
MNETKYEVSVDKSKKYSINAGKCDHCGFFKTWDVRVKNPKSGKMMPAHVNQEGYMINNGYCPYWSAIFEQKREKAQEKEDATSEKDTTKVKEKSPGDKDAATKQLEAIRKNGDVEIKINDMQFKLTKNEAIKLCYLILGILLD